MKRLFFLRKKHGKCLILTEEQQNNSFPKHWLEGYLKIVLKI